MSDTTIGWIILFGSICVASVGLGLRYQFRKQYRWPQVPAVIIESTVRVNGEAFDTLVRFEYSWQGRRLIGDTLRSGTISFNWRGPADRLRARFPVGTEVIAYVNDRDPRFAVLEPGGDRWMLPFALSIATFMAACATVIIRIGK